MLLFSLEPLVSLWIFHGLNSVSDLHFDDYVNDADTVSTDATRIE